MVLEEGDLVLCTVEKIVGTTVFVKINDYNDIEGTIVFSEIAPGRIRNIRDYVVPRKKIVCKVLKISGDIINLSLRRVTKKEQKEILDEHNKEKSYINIFKSILGERSIKIIEEIKQKQNFVDFIQKARENPELLEKFMKKEEAAKIIEIIKQQKKKNLFIKKNFHLISRNPEGLNDIKEILCKINDAEIKYLSAGNYLIKKESEDLKKTDNLLKEILEKIEKEAKKKNMEFSLIQAHKKA